ncbi:MAG: 4Fe-4S binding protein [Candidatus Eisenbacteria bacterium]|nr:4Fe-4S binding protein [Candidatus Eisenbacteria bacterium]
MRHRCSVRMTRTGGALVCYPSRMQKLRLLTRIAFVVIPVVVTYRFLSGASRATIETYCPVGALETMPFYLQTKSFLCAVSGINLWMLTTVVIGTLLVGRAFCSWICPVGTIVAGIGSLGRRIHRGFAVIWRGPLDHLKWLRFPALGVILVATYHYGDLVFRPFCPYFVGFSGHGHGIANWSYVLIPGLLLIGLALPFFWCRVLCPFGATLGVLRKVSPLAPTIQSGCTACGICDAACPQQIPVSERRRVADMDCTQCLSCVDSCPSKQVALVAGYRKPPVPRPPAPAPPATARPDAGGSSAVKEGGGLAP